jgi:hypothetical protein
MLPLHIFIEVLCTPQVALQTSKRYSFHFLPCLTKNISSDRCSSFPDWLFQVLDVLNTKILMICFTQLQN